MKYGLGLLFAGVLLISSVAMAGQNKGLEKFDLDGGSRGKVAFPHWKHQDALKDCNACHSVFPQQAGVIQSMKAAKDLKSKKVMNMLCIACHRAEARAGKPSGPVKCGDCHAK